MVLVRVVGLPPHLPLRLRAFLAPPPLKKHPPTPPRSAAGHAAGQHRGQGCNPWFGYFGSFVLLHLCCVFILFHAMATNGICFGFFCCFCCASVFLLFILFALIRWPFFHRSTDARNFSTAKTAAAKPQKYSFFHRFHRFHR